VAGANDYLIASSNVACSSHFSTVFHLQKEPTNDRARTGLILVL